MSLKDSWQTPKWLFNNLNAIYKFDYDVCATPENALACFKGDYFTNDFRDCTCWMNPPYSKPNIFVNRAIGLIKNNVKTVALLKSDTSTKIFHELFSRFEVIFIKKRVRFIHPLGVKTGRPNFASMLVVIDG